MKKITALAAAVFGIAAGANASMTLGEPIEIANHHTGAWVEFVGSEAAWTGVLSVINADSSTTPLFNNHTTAPGTIIFLGLFDAGAEIKFQYEVISGTANVFSMDDTAGAMQFGVTELVPGSLYRLGVEDIELPGGDQDYNDAEFNVHLASIPTPGALALAGLGGLLAATRRRK